MAAGSGVAAGGSFLMVLARSTPTTPSTLRSESLGSFARGSRATATPGPWRSCPVAGSSHGGSITRTGGGPAKFLVVRYDANGALDRTFSGRPT
jgi:hypothetical protein